MDLIIGAGISGLSYANFIENDFFIVEKESEPGGYCKTIKRNGFVWDYSGHFFHFQHPELEKYICKNISASSLLSVEKHTQIYYKGKYIDFPFQKNIHQLEKEELIECLYDLFTAGKHSYSTFKEMVYANLGKSIAEKFLIPYNEKLYACDLDVLDVNAMGRFFPKADKEDIILNFRSHDNSSYNHFFTYPRGGAIEYVYSLLKNIDQDKLSLNEVLQFVDVERKVAITNRREIKYDRLVSTLPFPQLLDICKLVYPDDVFSCNKEFIFYRIGYYDNIMNTDRMSLYVEIGFSQKQEMLKEGLYLDRILSDLRKMGIITTQKLVDYEAVLMNPAYVHINKKSVETVEEYKEILEKNDIYSIGRYGSWTYCSIEDNILEARELAEKLNK